MHGKKLSKVVKSAVNVKFEEYGPSSNGNITA